MSEPSIREFSISDLSISVVIRQLRLECDRVVSVELAAAGVDLPQAAPGAHIDVLLPGGLKRSYSLTDAADAHGQGVYRIAVKHEPAGRGGSRWFHQAARVGDTLRISAPANDFSLVEDAPHSVFIAGGIGITPLLAMIRRLVETGSSWELHYAAASRSAMPYRAEFERWATEGKGRVHLHFSEDGCGRMDVPAIVRGAWADAHLYCCGPAKMIDGFIDAAQSRSAATVHFERFAASQEAATQGGFILQLARDGRELAVPAGKTVLDVLLEAGIDVPYSCTQGVCGTCRVAVLQGEPEHRDDYLSDEEKAANDCMLVCCSGARSGRIALDL